MGLSPALMPRRVAGCSKIGGEVKGFDPVAFGIEKKDVKKTDLFVQFALAASLQAAKDAGLDMAKEDTSRVGVIIGSGMGGLSRHWKAA